MAHFAELDNNNKVIRVIVVNNAVLLNNQDNGDEALGADFCNSLLGGRWVQTSYNSSFRKNFAGTGYIYDSELDAFIAPQPYPSWILEESTCAWTSPTPYPNDGLKYVWNEETTSWEVENVS
jgi:hypothetical protein